LLALNEVLEILPRVSCEKLLLIINPSASVFCECPMCAMEGAEEGNLIFWEEEVSDGVSIIYLHKINSSFLFIRTILFR